MKLTDSVQYLKGVGQKRATLYEKLGVESIYALLHFYPRDYLDFANPVSVEEAAVGEVCCVAATVFQKLPEQRIRKGLSIFRVFATDGSHDLVITIYNNRYAYAALEMDQSYHFYGKVGGSLLKKEMNSPQFVKASPDGVLQPVYPLTEGLSSKGVATNVKQALDLWGDRLDDPLPDDIRLAEGLCHLRFAYENIHFPKNHQGLSEARRRLVFDELLTLQLGLVGLKGKQKASTAIQLPPTDLTPFFDALPFTLTDEQQAVILEAMTDLANPHPMNRLVQGDVGSGKTMVACALAFAMAKAGYQTAVMAPTEILANQHATVFQKTLQPLGVTTALLTGSLTATQKKEVRERMANGSVQVAIGTHALFQDSVLFDNLGLVVTDEQHRFGVNQRQRLAQKGDNPHRLVMSATPIPRTLALMIYGDLDLSAIHHPPKGRLPIATYLMRGNKRQAALGFIEEHIAAGEQAYIVCPLIDPSEAEGQEEMWSLSQYAELLSSSPLSHRRIGILHGKQKAAEKEAVMWQFKEGHLDVLLATTVVEVGVDVPNATVMMIENAEHFGLSQLHQLRGRVGRGNLQSHCILVSDHKGEATRERLKIMTKSADGFYIAEQDLKLRGPGDFFGARQHGLPALKVANLVDDMAVLQKTRHIAETITATDPNLTAPEHRGLAEQVSYLFSGSA